ncbi:MAG: 3-hydroxyacyl-CoA dehydrogenase family protein [Bacteroidales bacterium]|jgi:3-hydroxybutyryl-CoA dehydrogenase|nr:3-hydroxyacyl-CoA dehydrogenase family protein [Bacteroidales bacterium]
MSRFPASSIQHRERSELSSGIASEASPDRERSEPSSGIQKTGIIGEGKMGSGIFNYLLDFDLELTWICSKEADIGKIQKQFGKRINRSLEVGIIDENKYRSLQKTIISREISDLYQCDLIIEAIPEDIGLKRSLFEQLHPVINPGCIFASNSSSINPSILSTPDLRQDKFIGLHFFYPVALKNIVEFTVTAQTSSTTRSLIHSFLDKIQRFYLTLNERNSFILNKLFLDVQLEAILIVNEGHCSYQQMDEIIKKHMFPFGVFDFMDSVGIDTMLVSIGNYITGYPNKSYYEPLVSKLQELVREGKLGMKTGEGFYKYPLEPTPTNEPLETAGIAEHLYQSWYSAVKRFTAQSHIPIGDMNFAVKEYFGLEKGPFES